MASLSGRSRCALCVMPASLPGSDFDSRGVCRWCRENFPNYKPLGEDRLESVFQAYRGKRKTADCLVGVSGGKDSSFVLIELVRRYGLKVEAFTYTHSGLTEEALENSRRVCEAAGVRQHLVGLPGRKHLDSFATFFRAWLERHGVVAAALTCVACKHLHLLGTELAVRRGIPLVIWASSPIENPPFLSVAVKSAPGRGMARGGLLSGALHLTLDSLRSPALAAGLIKHFSLCLNGCLAFTPATRWLRLRYPRVRQLYFFEYCAWNPSRMRQNLISFAGWRPPDAPDDWHSDCLFNVFKEYMFQSMFGCSYTDAFLSNQVRKGLLSRESALESLLESKKHYRAQVPVTLEKLGLAELVPRLDPACFGSEEGGI